MYHQQLSDSEIISGFRNGDSIIIRDYFYDYCRVAYYVFDRRYDLSSKDNLDFMSLAHQYAIHLIEHDWKPLENHAPSVSLRTWLIGGFRYVVLDALKWYHKVYGSISFNDYLQSFNINTDNLRLQFNRMIADICDHAPLEHQDRVIIDLLLLQGYKVKDVAAQMGISSSAISQRYKKLKEQFIIPYFKKYFDMDLDMFEVLEEPTSRLVTPSCMPTSDIASFDTSIDINETFIKLKNMNHKRTTPEIITELKPGEIFVFGSNLKGMHGGGAAYFAYRKFGAIMGQGVGLQGQSYAIPTMQGGVETIQPYVDQFIRFASDHPELTFLVTRIGCGIAGFTDEEIAPLFAKAHTVQNIILPEGW